MRFPKLFISALTSCVFAGASGSAMAEGCGDGVLQGERFDGTLRVSDETSCTIIGSTIGGPAPPTSLKIPYSAGSSL
jgi:TRAP-type C4-dicarboxylate transport system permease large subunit